MDRDALDTTLVVSDIELALQKGKTEWSRSKIMIVGEGRAGKTSFANALIGTEYVDTESTIGVNQLAVSIMNANITGSDGGWVLAESFGNEHESAVARMIANKDSLMPLHLCQDQENLAGVDSVLSTVAHSLPENVAPVATMSGVNESLCEPIISIEEREAKRNESDLNALNAGIGRFMDVGAGGSIQKEPLKLSMEEANAFDNELVMKCLAQNAQLQSKFLISVYDFGGQSVFHVYRDVTNMMLLINNMLIYLGYTPFFSHSLWYLCSGVQYGGKLSSYIELIAHSV